MAYNADKDRFKFHANESTLGAVGRVVAASDTADLDPYAKAIVVTAGGNLVIIPVQNDDAATITFTAVPAGFITPYRVRRVLATGTTASWATIEG